jgi:hypothetical protein
MPEWPHIWVCFLLLVNNYLPHQLKANRAKEPKTNMDSFIRTEKLSLFDNKLFVMRSDIKFLNITGDEGKASISRAATSHSGNRTLGKNTCSCG